MATNNNPDLLYLLPRESLLLFEDARLLGLLQATANYYLPRNDQPQWGYLLRVIAQELAKLEYDYQYDIQGIQPQFLTPPDIKRRDAASLQIKSAYPYPNQFDKGDFTGFGTLDNPVGYRDMLVDLIKAYGMGATANAIAAVIYAYTGKTVQVVELYKLIGQGVYDQSDRNAIQVSVNVGGNNPLNNVLSLTQLQEIVQNLYGAIDLAKPAHVGLEFTTVFTEAENVSLNINDILRIIIQQVEAPPLGPMLWVAPLFDPKHPKTTLAAYGRRLTPTLSQADWEALYYAPTSPPTLLPAEWDSGTTYARGTLVQYSTASPIVPSYQMYRALKRNTNQPPTIGASNAYWKLLPSPSVWQAYYRNSFGMYTVGISPWMALTTYYTGQFIIDPNGNLQIAIVGGVSAMTAPDFSKTPGGTVTDGTTSPPTAVTWECLGTNYLVDPSQWIQIGWVANGVFTPTGEVANWSVNNPMGLLAPRENTVWEVKSDTLNIFNEN